MNNPQNQDPKIENLIKIAAQLIVEFDTSGGEIQCNSEGVFDQTTTIEKLRGALHLIKPGIVSEGDYLPWLSTEQQKKLEEVAAEIISCGNGENIRDIEYGQSISETMLPLERLEQLEDDHVRRCERLGFDPKTGEIYTNKE